MKTKLLLILLFLTITSFGQTNLVPNGDFETWTYSSQPDKWFGYLSGSLLQSTTAQNGTSSTKVEIASGAFSYFNSEFFAVEAGKIYRVTLYHKVESGSFTSLDFSLYNKPGVFKQEIIKKTETVFSTSNWSKIEFDYTSPTSQNIEVDVWANGATNSQILIDNVSVVDLTPPALQYTLIPDANFENKLISLGIDSGTADGKVLTSSVSGLTTLNVSNSSITDLSGIEDFVSLTDLNCSKNLLATINLSKNTKLVSLNIGYNQLNNLDVTSNVLLQELDCQRNLLTDLNVSKNIKLIGLNAMINKLTNLDVTQNTFLTGLFISSNKLASLNIDSNIVLTELNCGSNNLATLNVSNNTLLTSLVCHYNQISSLNVSKNILLEQLMCHFNEITTLDVSNNPKLYMLDCLNNKITKLDISKNPKITELACQNNLLNYLNLKNGNNINLDLTYSSFLNNPNLTCIEVDEVAYSNTKWSSIKDATTQFNTDCRPYTLIPDINFEKKLIALSIDSGTADGKVLTSSISNLKSLNVSNSNITDLTGIEDFVSLTDLNCYSNKLTNLDLSKNIALKSLDCFENQLTSINISKNILLTYLDCDTDYLTTLDVSNNTQLTTLRCSGKSGSSNTRGSGKLTSLNVSKNTLLTNLYCDSNQITNLDVSQNIALKFLLCSLNRLSSLNTSNNTLLNLVDCSANDIASLDFSNNLALKTIKSSINKLTSINISKNTDLIELECISNLLTSLDVSKNTSLTRLLCGNNNLTSLNLKNGKNTLLKLTLSNIMFWANPNLKCIQVDNAAYSEANWSNVKDITAEFNTDCRPYTLIPDINFENKLISLGIDSGTADGKVPTSSISTLTDLDISKSEIANLTGIQDFTSLKYLNCSNNSITSLDFSSNLALENIQTQNNQLTFLNVSKNTSLTILACYNNKLTTLDISTLTALKKLSTNTNNLTALNIYNNNALTDINCGENKLETLNVSKNTNLINFYCHNNLISNLDISSNPQLENFICNDNKLTLLNVTNNPKLVMLDCLNNKITKLDISQNPKITELACQNNLLNYLNLKNGYNINLDLTYSSFLNNPNLTCIEVDDVAYSNTKWSSIKDATTQFNTDCRPYTLIPDINFEKKLIALSIDSGTTDGKVLTSSISNLISLNVSNSNITDLTGIEDFTALKYFSCYTNKITSVDFSKNLMLENLDVKENNLTILDVSKNVKLRNLEFAQNQITSIDLSQNVNLLGVGFNFNKITEIDLTHNNLEHLHCRGNTITKINLTNQTNLVFLEIGLNKIASLDLTANKKLEQLECAHMGLTALNVSENKELVFINAFGNELTSLDVSQNPKLKALYVEYNPLTTLNLKNGNNANFILANPTNKSQNVVYTSFLNNPNLSCIQVDNVEYSNSNWLKIKDATANYNADCNAFTMIPDSNFEDKLIELKIDKDGKNGKVQTASISALTYLDVSNSNISNLKGIEDFFALTYLDCNVNNISNIDISHNKLLTKFAIHGNKLSSLDITANTELFNLTFSKNQISTIDLSQNKKLHYVIADRNLLTNIDFSLNPELEMIYCGSNKLTTLNVSNLANLTDLNCIYTSISTLDVTSNPKLVNLYFNNANLTTLNLTKNPLLKRLQLSWNQLTTLDLSQNPNLELVFLEFNPLTSLNVQNGNNKNFILPSQTGKKDEASIYTSFLGNKALSCIKVDDPAFSNANWSKIKEETTVYSATCSLGLESSIFDKAVVYPNPTKGEVNINNIALDKVTVYNTIGQLVKSFTLDSGNANNTIDLSGLPKGVYYLYLINQDTASAKKIIVE